MADSKVIELSIEETNELRAKLGLAPLRNVGGDPKGDVSARNESQKPSEATSADKVIELSVDESNDLRAKLGLAPLRIDTMKKEIHKPAANLAEVQQTQERIEHAKLQREVQQGIARFSQNTFEDKSTAKSWASRMRKTKGATLKQGGKKTKKATAEYQSQDLEGMHVAHAISDLTEGSTTVLTLQDTSLLQEDKHRKVVGLNDGDDVQKLENVEISDQKRVEKGLREKRKVEMGMGRAGGYAGFDDDEFEEMGGSQAAMGVGEDGRPKLQRGFRIGAISADDEKSDLFAAEKGKFISLAPSQADVTASDFMTVEEAERDRKKKMKFKKKDKKKKKKSSKRKQRDEEGSEDETTIKTVNRKGGRSLLEELEATAESTTGGKRRRRTEEDDDRAMKPMEVESENTSNIGKDTKSKMDNYELAMERGSQRTKHVFAAPKKPVVQVEDAEPDDAFLDAALDKARRLNRLKAMSASRAPSGAASVLEAVKNGPKSTESSTGGTAIEFSVDETREFTRALRTRTDQVKREKKKEASSVVVPKTSVETVQEEDENETMAELAKSVKEDASDGALEGVTGATASIGRGVGGFLQLLQQTGESRLKTGGREEMRGRAKDKKTYEDYAPLDLNDVVKIDMRTASDKDRELAQREIKLEYRDGHGRLLTRKEAFRELCYSFHGHGSGKRKEEKKLQQIAREQAEIRAAGQEGTLQALKATQKATGKAFVVHKTQS